MWYVNPTPDGKKNSIHRVKILTALRYLVIFFLYMAALNKCYFKYLLVKVFSLIFLYILLFSSWYITFNNVFSRSLNSFNYDRSKDWLWFYQGCINFPAIWYSFPPSSLIFLPQISVPFPFSPLDNLPYSLIIIEQMITCPYHFFYVVFFPKALNLPSSLHNLKFFPKGSDKLPPPQGWGKRNFILPWILLITGY